MEWLRRAVSHGFGSTGGLIMSSRYIDQEVLVQSFVILTLIFQENHNFWKNNQIPAIKKFKFYEIFAIASATCGQLVNKILAKFIN